MFTNNLIAGAAGQSTGFYPYAIDQSLRFNDNDSAYLSRTPASTTNRKTWTWSGWVKIGNLVGGVFFSSGLVSGTFNYQTIGFSGNDRLNFNYYPDSSTGAGWLSTARLFRDPSAWYHIHAVWDTTQATSTDRMRLYVNGVQETVFVTETFSERYPAQNTDGFVNNSSYSHSIGKHVTGSSPNYFDGYMAEINFVDGQALEPTEFGEFKSGVWVAKEYTGTYGTNGFHLTFADSGAIGDDTSGNTNDWTANNLAATDVLLDSPTGNNFAVLNAVDKEAPATLLEGNLWIYSSASDYQACRSTLAMPSGLWYAEATTTGDRLMSFGIYNVVPRITDLSSTFTNAYVLFNNGVGTRGTRSNNVTSNSRTADAANDVFQCAFNADTGKVWLGRNNTWFGGGDPSAGTSPTYTVADGIYAFVASGGNGSGQPLKINFGQSAFAYTEPTDFLPLNTANLPDPTIDPAQDDVPSDYFNTVLWTGDGTSGRTVTGTGFQADLIWIKNRSSGTFTHQLVDAVRGKLSGANSYARLRSDSTATEATPGGDDGLTAIGSDGFTVDADESYNNSGNTFVAWNWLAGNSTSSNTTGSISSTVSVNEKAGFSIVSYTGNGTAGATIGHSLGAVPAFIMIKGRTNSDNWMTKHKSYPSNLNFIELNTTNALGSATDVWNNTAPTSTVFSVGTGATVNSNGVNYICYAFAEVEGYSSFGKYTGNGSADGPFIFTGHAPAFVMVKGSSLTSQWNILDIARDTYNVADKRLFANLSNAEATGINAFDMLSNGFKIRNSDAGFNQSGATYIYMSFASNPFKFSTAR